MKPQWLILVGVAGLAAVLSFIYLADEPAKKTPETKKEASAEGKPVAAESDKPKPKGQSILDIPVENRTPLPPEQQAAVIAQGELISDLFDAGSDGAPDKVEKVYTALGHSDPEVREAAVDVIVQYVGRDGIPRLRAAMAATDSLDEKKNIQEAIEFIELPSISELKEGKVPAAPAAPQN